MALTSQQIDAIERVNTSRKGEYNYPATTIEELIDTIRSVRKEKKKWQRLAQERA